MRRALSLLLVMTGLMVAGADSYAQMQDPVTALDQSLFDSEPVEEIPPPSKTPALPTPPPAAATPVVETPVTYDTARLQGLNKVTAETSLLEVALDTPVTFGTLTITAKKCVSAKPAEQPDHAALLVITEQAASAQTASTVFSGWMFAASPSLSGLEHAVYDVTLLGCGAAKKK